MKSILDKARKFRANLAVQSRNLVSLLTKKDFNITNIIKPSPEQLHLNKTKEYFRKHSQRRNRAMIQKKKQNNVKRLPPVFIQKLKSPSALNRENISTVISSFSRIKNLKLRLSPSKFFSTEKSKKVFAILVAVICLVGVSGAAIANSTLEAVAVKIDGKPILLVKDKKAAKETLEQLKKEKTGQWKQKLMVQEKVTFEETEAKRYQIGDLEDLKLALNKNLTFVGVATAIKADGKVMAVLENEAAANSVLEELKKRFSSNINNMQLDSIAFKEKVEIEEIPATLREVAPVDQVVEKLVNGEEKAKVHVVKSGESLWTIARKYDTHVADLKAANPALKGDNPKLDIGQELKLVKVEPLVTVVATAQATMKETIPYKVKVETDKKLWKGSQKTKQQGENGSREVTYKLVFANGAEVERQVLQEKILKPAKDKVVVRGARLVVASRGGSGTLAWPTSGKITSRYGRRWGRMHTGIDIDGRTGQPIGAAEDGKVVSTGWDGAYGKQVTIDHGNGIKTKYAHLSSINVSVGERVSRGELVGKMGNTGRSTGSHLHFEVIVSGGFRNPMSYLK